MEKRACSLPQHPQLHPALPAILVAQESLVTKQTLFIVWLPMWKSFSLSSGLEYSVTCDYPYFYGWKIGTTAASTLPSLY